MNEIEILCSLDSISFDLGVIREFVDEVLDKLSIDNWLMGILLTNDDEIREYNRQWRQIDSPTDVLSFVQKEGDVIPKPDGVPEEAGDIVVSLQRVGEQASQLNRPVEEELRRVIIHGILHLNGLEHPGDDYEGKMLKLQEVLVSETRSLAVSE